MLLETQFTVDSTRNVLGKTLENYLQFGSVKYGTPQRSNPLNISFCTPISLGDIWLHRASMLKLLASVEW